MGPKVDVMLFDSGVGGLSVLASLRRLAPKLSACYVADNEGLPYGNKSEEWLLARIPQVIEEALTRMEASILVVACNTASTLVLPLLRERLKIPVVGVVPAIKPAAETSLSRVIGLLATPATVQRSYTDDLIRDFASNCTVHKLGALRLVDIAEGKLRGEPVSLVELKTLLDPLMQHKPDTVVMACTHFPLLRDEFSLLYPGVSWLDSGDAIARRVLQLRSEAMAMPSASDGTGFFTRLDIDAQALASFGIRQLISLKIQQPALSALV